MIDYRMETFVKLCEEMNYTRTAQALNITQPTVTGHIQSLESHYQCKLFSWDGKDLSLTLAGEKLYRYALPLLANEGYLKATLKEVDGGFPPLNIGATKSAGLTLLSSLMLPWIKKNPTKLFSIKIANTKELLKELDQRSLDGALIEGYFPMEDYESFSVAHTPFIGIISPDHPLVKRKIRSWKDLFEERIYVREPGSGSRQIFTDMLKRSNYELASFKNMCEVDEVHVITQLVAKGTGIAFLYEDLVKEELRAGKLMKLKLPYQEEEREIRFVHLKESILGPTWKEIFKK